MFTAQESTEVRRPAGLVFAVLDDFAHMSTWLEACVSLQATPPGARDPGTPLRYQYAMAGQEGVMTGTITAYAPEKELAMQLADTHFGVTWNFRLEPTEFGTRVHHAIGIELKAQIPRYMEAMIQAGNRRQVGANLTRLKKLVESTSEPPLAP